MNGDGFRDLAVAAPAWQFINVLGYRDGHSFAVLRRETYLDVPEFGIAVVGGDVDGDGYSDVFVGSAGRVHAFFGAPADTPEGTRVVLGNTTPAVGASPFGTALAIADLQGDGFVDLVVGAATEGNGRVYVFRGGPDFRDVAEPVVFEAPPAVTSIGRVLSTGDYDGDGFSDVLVGARNHVLVLYGGRDLEGLVVTDAPAGMELRTVVSGDIDGDGRSDLAFSGAILSAGVTTEMLWWQFGAARSFEARDVLVEGALVPALNLSDFDSDGRTELAASATDGAVGSVSVQRHTGRTRGGWSTLQVPATARSGFGRTLLRQ